MKWQLFIFAIASIILFSSCSGVRQKQTDEAILMSELKKWESFQGEGIVQINAMGLSIRKPFVIAKNRSVMRLDVIDGGIYGASASPLLSVYLGDYFSLRAPIMPALEALNAEGFAPKAALQVFSSADSIFARYGKEIIANKTLGQDKITITFKKNYQLVSVTDTETKSQILASYTSNGNLDTITVVSGKDVDLKFLFDRVTYTEPEITPLPKRSFQGKDLMQMLENSGMMDIFKGIMGN